MSQQPQTQFGTESQYQQQPQVGYQQQSSTTLGGTQQGATRQFSMEYGQGTQLGTAQQGQSGGQMAGQWSQSVQQPSGPQQHVQSQMDRRIGDALTQEMEVALSYFNDSIAVCEWCAERCADHGPEMSECLRLCRDVAELAALNAKLMTRDSVFGPEAVELFITAADMCARECAKHPQSHCQECADVLSGAVQSSQQMLASFQGPQGSQTMGGQQLGPATQQQTGIPSSQQF